MNRDELLAMGMTVDLAVVAKALGIGRTLCYQLARSGELPVPVLRLGVRYRVSTSALLAALEPQPPDLLAGDRRKSPPTPLRPVSGL